MPLALPPVCREPHMQCPRQNVVIIVKPCISCNSADSVTDSRLQRPARKFLCSSSFPLLIGSQLPWQPVLTHCRGECTEENKILSSVYGSRPSDRRHSQEVMHSPWQLSSGCNWLSTIFAMHEQSSQHPPNSAAIGETPFLSSRDPIGRRPWSNPRCLHCIWTPS